LISVHSISARSTQAIYCPTFGMSPTGWANVKPNTTANSTLPTVFTRRPWTQARARLPRFGHSGVYSNSFRTPKYPVLPSITHKDLKFLLGDLILPRPHYGYSDLVLPPHQIIQTYKPETCRQHVPHALVYERPCTHLSSFGRLRYSSVRYYTELH
jgi:hypothetical protein